MSDGIFAVILALGGLCVIGFGAVMAIVPRIEAQARMRQSSHVHPAE